MKYQDKSWEKTKLSGRLLRSISLEEFNVRKTHRTGETGDELSENSIHYIQYIRQYISTEMKNIKNNQS